MKQQFNFGLAKTSKAKYVAKIQQKPKAPQKISFKFSFSKPESTANNPAARNAKSSTTTGKRVKERPNYKELATSGEFAPMPIRGPQPKKPKNQGSQFNFNVNPGAQQQRAYQYNNNNNFNQGQNQVWKPNYSLGGTRSQSRSVSKNPPRIASVPSKKRPIRRKPAKRKLTKPKPKPKKAKAKPKPKVIPNPPYLPVEFNPDELFLPKRPQLEDLPQLESTAKKAEIAAVELRIKELTAKNKKINQEKNSLSKESRKQKKGAARRRNSSQKKKYKRSYSETMSEDSRSELTASGRTRRKRKQTEKSADDSRNVNRAKKPEIDYSGLNLSEEMEESIRLVDTVIYRDNNLYFVQPVDAIALGLDDYHDVVSDPMDFGTVRNKILSHLYVTFMDVYEDLELICNNCILYNTANSHVGKEAKRLRTIWKRGGKKILLRFHPEEAAKLNPPKKASKKKKYVKKKRKEKPKPMTWDEKAQLVYHIQELPPEEMAKIVQIVSEENPKDLEGGEEEGGEIELDLASMPDSTLRKLEEHVKEYRVASGQEVTEVASFVVPDEELDEDDAEEEEEEEEFEEPKKKKKRRLKQRARRKQVIDDAPEEEEEVVDLQTLKERSKKTTDNTRSSIQEIQDELARLAGRVVDKDHLESGANSSLYSFDPTSIAMDAAAQPLSSDSEDSDDTISGEDDNKNASPTAKANNSEEMNMGAWNIAPEKGEAPNVNLNFNFGINPLENHEMMDMGVDMNGSDFDNMAALDTLASSNGNNGSNENGLPKVASKSLLDPSLLSEFATKDTKQKELEEENQIMQEKLKQQALERQRELEQQQLEKQQQALEEEKVRKENEMRKRAEQAREQEIEIERAREREKKKREEQAQEVGLGDQGDLMAEFAAQQFDGQEFDGF